MSSRIRALDGLRGFALVGMLGWHAQLDWIRGGFARMTVFFVLSGFLATLSLRRGGTGIDVGHFARFWARRARRLLPVTLVGVGLAVVVTARWAGPAARRDVTGDAVSVLTSWSNWRFVVQNHSYGAMFESPSAFEHYWSLSVEEQCILVLPLVLAALALVVGSATDPSAGDRRLAAAVAVVGGAAAAIPLFVTMAPDTAYYGTHVRIGEFLAGAALAIGWEMRPSVERSPRAVRSWGAAGTLGLAVLLAVMAFVDRDVAWVYRGGMGLMAVPVLAVITAALVGAGVANRALSVAPLVALGRAAMSIYVVHWPVYLVVESELAGSSRTTIVLVEIALSLAVGAGVHLAIERPLLPGAPGRAAQWLERPRIGAPALAAVAALCIVATTLIPGEGADVDFGAIGSEPTVATSLSLDEARRVLSDGVSKGAELPVIRDPELVGVGLFGGSGALTLALGADGWAQDPVWAQPVPGYSPLGCGVLDTGERGDGDAGNRIPSGAVPAECTERSLRWSATVKAHSIQIPVIVASAAELTTWRFREGDAIGALGERAVDVAVATALLDATDAMIAAGAQRVVVTTHMMPDRSLPPDLFEERAARNLRYRELLDGLAAERAVDIVDLGAWSAALDDADYRRLVPDGLHLSLEGARRAWSELLGPSLDRLWETGEVAPA